MDSSKFDLRLMNSGAISLKTPTELSQGLAPYISDLIMDIPQEEDIELRLRSIVDILVISKLQSDYDRTELDAAKNLVITGQDTIINAKTFQCGLCEVLNLGHWTIININAGASIDSVCLCDNISEVIYKMASGQHMIFDFSQLKKIDLRLAAYLIGLQGMLLGSGKQMSLAWLPKSAVSEVSQSTHNSLMTKFNLFRKGTFLLSSGA